MECGSETGFVDDSDIKELEICPDEAAVMIDPANMINPELPFGVVLVEKFPFPKTDSGALIPIVECIEPVRSDPCDTASEVGSEVGSKVPGNIVERQSYHW